MENAPSLDLDTERSASYSSGRDKVSDLKLPPHSIEAEQAVLGAMMLDNSSWEKIADKISEEDFYRQDHRLIFRAIAGLADQDQPCDAVTVSEWLERHDLSERAGGLPYVALLANETGSSANVAAYAGIVRERSILRHLISAGNEITESAYNPQGRDSAEILDSAERRVFDIADGASRDKEGFKSVTSLSTRAVQMIDDLYESDGSITGIATGIKQFDEMTAGLQKSDLIILAARPAMGKTAFVLNIAERAAIQEKKKVALFSLEMSGEQLVTRMISSLARIDQQKVRTGQLAESDWPRISTAVGLIDGAPMYIDDTGGISPTEMRARVRRLKREMGGLDIIIVDYLQLMSVPGFKENRTNEMSEISRGLKQLAKEMNCPVVALSQLNRGVEQRDNKRPRLSDIRESGGIEQDADVIVFLYRDEYYNPESQDKGKAEIIIGKQRNGPTGTANATFLGQYTRFENYVSEIQY